MSMRIWVFHGISKNSGKTPQIINSNRGFHYFHHPFWWLLCTPIFGSTPMFMIQLTSQHLGEGYTWRLAWRFNAWIQGAR